MSIKNKMSFVLTLISILGLFGLAYFKDVDIALTLPTVLGIFVAGRTFISTSHGWAASKDPKANTVETIKSLEEKD